MQPFRATKYEVHWALLIETLCPHVQLPVRNVFLSFKQQPVPPTTPSVIGYYQISKLPDLTGMNEQKHIKYLQLSK